MKPLNATLIVASLLSTASALAGMEVYFGEDVSPFAPGVPNDVPVPIYTNSQYVAAQFLDRLPSVVTESFEGLMTGSAPSTLWSGANAAPFAGSTREVRTMVDATNAIGGGFATTGTNYVALIYSTPASVFATVTFANPQAAFGFYGEDVEPRQFQIAVYHTNGSTSTIPVPTTVPQGSGGVFYLGLIDEENPFTKVEFQSIGAGTDGIFLDDLTISGPELVQLNIHVSQVGLCWDTVAGNSYQLQYQSPATTNTWLPLGGPVVGDGDRFCTNDMVLPWQPKRFYRLVLMPSP